MDLSWRFDPWIRRLPPSPRDGGQVVRTVRRPSGGEREAPGTLEVTREGGVTGDRWRDDLPLRMGAQVSLINVHVIDSLTGGDAERALLVGDNLHVDLDLSEQNLPVGTRLAIGSAVLEVSDEVHRPCRSFHERFGATGAKKVARMNRIGLRGRGVLCRVVQDGAMSVGDGIAVTRQ